jgi:hypothetical protein
MPLLGTYAVPGVRRKKRAIDGEKGTYIGPLWMMVLELAL